MPAPPLVRVSSNLGGSNVEITEDTPADLLEGCMELRIILPNNRKVRSHYERRTPMMDLLVQIATSQRLAPGDHFLQIADDVTGNPIQFLPSTLLGALDARTVQIVPKNRIIDTKVSKSAKNLNLPFEQTFRLKVYLPRNQLFVTRVSAHTTVSTVLSVICKEKNLDPEKFELRHPVNRDEKLHISATLADYGICEVALVATGKLDPAGSSWSVMSRTSNSNGSSATNVQPPKQKKGLFSFMFGKKQSKSSMGDSSLSSDSIGDRSLSPSRSQSPGTPESVSPATPPLATSSVISAPTQNGRMAPAKSMETISLISDTSSSRGMSRFKKRQAPIPPPTNRMSSPLSKEQLSKLPGGDYKLSSPFSKSTTNLYYENRAGNRLSMSNLTSTNSTSTSSILSAIRKGKKAPPPPNPPPQESEQIKREELRVEEVHLPPEPDGQIKEAGVVSSGVEDIVKPSSPQPCVDPVRSSPVEVENDKKDSEMKEGVQSSGTSDSEVDQEKPVEDPVSFKEDSVEIKTEASLKEVPLQHLEEQLSYDDVANTSDEHGDEPTIESDTYEDIDLSKENKEVTEEKAIVATADDKEEMGSKNEPVYAQVNKKKRDSKQEEIEFEVVSQEIRSSPISEPSPELSSSFNDSAIDIPHTSVNSDGESPIDSWEYRVPGPPTPFKDLSSDEEVSDIVSDLLNTASFQEALLNEEFNVDKSMTISDGVKSLSDDSRGSDELRGEMEDLSETGPSAIVIKEVEEQVSASTVTLSHEQMGESSTDAQPHLVVNRLYETIGTRTLKELTVKDAHQFSEILQELSEILKKSDVVDEVKDRPAVPETPPPSTSGEASRRSSISVSDHGTIPPSPSQSQVFRNPMRFSISTYKSRVEEEGFCYEKKLSRSESVKECPLFLKDFRPLRRRDSDGESDRQSSSSSTKETRDQNENIVSLKFSEPVDNVEKVESAFAFEPDVHETFISEISTQVEVIQVAEIGEPLAILQHEIEIQPVPLSVPEVVEEAPPVLALDLSKLEPNEPLFAVVEPDPISSGDVRSEPSPSACTVETPQPDPVTPFELLLPAPSLFADDEDPEARHLQEEYMQFQQRLLAYQQKRLSSTTKPKEQPQPQQTLAEPIRQHAEEKIPQLPEKMRKRSLEIQSPPPPMMFRTTTPPKIFSQSRHQESVKSNGPMVVTLNEDHIRAFSEIMVDANAEKETSPDLYGSKEPSFVPEILAAPPRFDSGYPVMLDGVSQTESEDSHSVLSTENESRPESRASLRSDSVDDDIPRYRYQGPPKIVMETWRSRPSVHVSISANTVSSYNIEELETKMSAKKEERSIEAKVEPIPKSSVTIEAIKLKPVKIEKVESVQAVEVAPTEERSQVVRPKLNFETSRSAFEIEGERKKTSLVRRTSIDTPRPFELKTAQIRRPMFNPVQVGNKLVQPKMPFRVPEVRGFPLRPHVEEDEKPAVVDKNRHDLIAMARRPSAEREDMISISSEGRKSPVKARDEVDSMRKWDVVVLRKTSPVERPKSVDDLDMVAPEIRSAVLKPAPLKHAVSADFQASFWNELNGVKLRPVSGKQLEASAPVPSPPCPPPPPMEHNRPVALLPKKSSSSSRFQPSADPRDELLSSIKNFGASGRLKKTGNRLL